MTIQVGGDYGCGSCPACDDTCRVCVSEGNLPDSVTIEFSNFFDNGAADPYDPALEDRFELPRRFTGDLDDYATFLRGLGYVGFDDEDIITLNHDGDAIECFAYYDEEFAMSGGLFITLWHFIYKNDLGQVKSMTGSFRHALLSAQEYWEPATIVENFDSPFDEDACEPANCETPFLLNDASGGGTNVLSNIAAYADPPDNNGGYLINGDFDADVNREYDCARS